MGLLKYVLQALQVLAVLFCASVFVFDAKQRRFRQHAWLKLWLKVVHLCILVPWLFVLLILTSYALFTSMLAVVHTHFEGSTTLYAISISLILLLPVSRYVLLVYIIHLYKNRVGQLEQLLNDFVSVYDQYVALFGLKLRINWFAGVVLFCKFFAIDFIFWIVCLLHTDFASFSALYFTMGAPMIGSFAGLVALLLLHALFRGATLSHNHILWQQCLDRRRTQQLLGFYEDMLLFHENLEKFIKPFIAMQLMADAICILPPLQFIKQLGGLVVPFVTISLVYPCLHAWLCHDMVTAEHKMGNELLTVHCEHVDDEASKLVELFCLQKLLKERLNHRSWRLLYLCKDFILEFINISWVNGMFLRSIAYSDNAVRMFQWENPRLLLKGESGNSSLSFDSRFKDMPY